jgi:DNA modification methylase
MTQITIGDATLYLGNCLEVLPELQVDVVVTDPPYGIGYQSGWATDALWQAGRTITNDATIVMRDTALALLAGTPALVFGSRKVPPPPGTRMVLIWDKGPALGMGALDLPWKPSWEEIYVLGEGFHGYREGGVLYHHPTQAMACNGRRHPNEKPVGLISKLLAKCPVGVVADPFMGSGTVGVACANAGRKFVGIEIEREYFDIACERISAAYAQGRLFA